MWIYAWLLGLTVAVGWLVLLHVPSREERYHRDLEWLRRGR